MSEDAPLWTTAVGTGSPPLYAYLIAGCAALNSVNFGYDVGVNSGVSLILQQQWSLTEWEVGIYVGSLAFITAAGALLTSGLADLMGRCKAFAVSQVFFILGLGISCNAMSFEVLMFGRLLVGVGMGMGFAIDPMYIAEISPPSHRGALTSWSELSINLGIMMGFVANATFAPMEDDISWRVMLAVGLILPSMLLVLALCVMPESPRWLLMQGREEEAASVMQRTHPAEAPIAQMLQDLKRQVAEQESEAASWADVLCVAGPMRRQVLIGIGVAIAQQANGLNSVLLFAPRIFARAGFNENQQLSMTAMMGFTKTFFVGVAACFLDNHGRRPLLIISNVAMAASYVLLAISLEFHFNLLAVAAVNLVVAAFSIGMGPICWLMASEVFPVKLRGRGVSLATAGNRVTAGIIATTFLPIARVSTFAGYFNMFAGVSLFIALLMFWFVPETKLMTLEQVTTSFGIEEAEEAKPE